MRQPLRILTLALSLLALHALLLSAQSYGRGDQILTIGATAFRPQIGSDTSYFIDSGTSYLVGPGVYLAPLTLPDGAEIVMMCVYAFDPDPPANVLSQIQVVGLPVGGQSPGGTRVSQVIANFDTGYGVACSGPFSYVVHDAADIGQGSEALAHRVLVEVSGDAALGAVRISWHRQVSSSPVAATFGDVPTTDPGFLFVEAVAASRVTAGCGGGNYCPDALLTRRQLAVFLAKALGLHWPN